jgi:flagellar basal-body rod protein FlgC
MKIRGIFSSMDISATGLAAQRRRMDAIAENIANTDTTRTPEGGPYRRRISYFTEDRAGVETVKLKKKTDHELEINYSHKRHMTPFDKMFMERRYSGVEYGETRDNTTPEFVYDPHHPDADQFGYVAKPKINIIVEMTEMISATRNYEANATAMDAAKGMARKALEI